MLSQWTENSTAVRLEKNEEYWFYKALARNFGLLCVKSYSLCGQVTCSLLRLPLIQELPPSRLVVTERSKIGFYSWRLGGTPCWWGLTRLKRLSLAANAQVMKSCRKTIWCTIFVFLLANVAASQFLYKLTIHSKGRKLRLLSSGKRLPRR